MLPITALSLLDISLLTLFFVSISRFLLVICRFFGSIVLRLLTLSLSLGVSLSIVSCWELLFVSSGTHDAFTLIHEPGVANASLVVIPVIETEGSGEGHEVAAVRLDTLGEVLSV